MDDLSLVLASSSPRRREILSLLCTGFTIESADIDESPQTGETPVEYVRRLAREKAATVVRPRTAVIGSDTAVVIDGEIVGKPDGPAHSAAILRSLSGRSHEVITGVAVAVTGADGTTRVSVDLEFLEVHFVELTEKRVEWYIATGEGADKAGAYGLQGAGGLFVERVEGSVSNIIGLPMTRLDAVCQAAGFDLVAMGRPAS